MSSRRVEELVLFNSYFPEAATVEPLSVSTTSLTTYLNTFSLLVVIAEKTLNSSMKYTTVSIVNRRVIRRFCYFDFAVDTNLPCSRRGRFASRINLRGGVEKLNEDSELFPEPNVVLSGDRRVNSELRLPLLLC